MSNNCDNVSRRRSEQQLQTRPSVVRTVFTESTDLCRISARCFVNCSVMMSLYPLILRLEVKMVRCVSYETNLTTICRGLRVCRHWKIGGCRWLLSICSRDVFKPNLVLQLFNTASPVSFVPNILLLGVDCVTQCKVFVLQIPVSGSRQLCWPFVPVRYHRSHADLA